MVLFSLILPAGIATSRDAAATSSITFPLDDAGVKQNFIICCTHLTKCGVG